MPPQITQQDKTVRLWDLNSQYCVAVLSAPAQPVAAFDQQGLVFAVGADAGVIKLYDAAGYTKGPFETIVVSAGVRMFVCLRWARMQVLANSVTRLDTQRGPLRRLR